MTISISALWIAVKAAIFSIAISLAMLAVGKLLNFDMDTYGKTLSFVLVISYGISMIISHQLQDLSDVKKELVEPYIGMIKVKYFGILTVFLGAYMGYNIILKEGLSKMHIANLSFLAIISLTMGLYFNFKVKQIKSRNLEIKKSDFKQKDEVA